MKYNLTAGLQYMTEAARPWSLNTNAERGKIVIFSNYTTEPAYRRIETITELTRWYNGLVEYTGDTAPPAARFFMPLGNWRNYDIAPQENIRIRLATGEVNPVTLDIFLTVHRLNERAAGFDGLTFYPEQAGDDPAWPANFMLDDVTAAVDLWRGRWEPLSGDPGEAVDTEICYRLIDSNLDAIPGDRATQGRVLIETTGNPVFYDPLTRIRITISGREIPYFIAEINQEHNRRGRVELTLNPDAEAVPGYLFDGNGFTTPDPS